MLQAVGFQAGEGLWLHHTTAFFSFFLPQQLPGFLEPTGLPVLQGQHTTRVSWFSSL